MAMHNQGDNWSGRQQVEPAADDPGLPKAKGELKKKKLRKLRKIKADQKKIEWEKHVASLPEDHWLKILHKRLKL